MRLSEAILAGSTLIKWGDGSSYCNCAIGMGLHAVGSKAVLVGWGVLRDAYKRWPWLAEMHFDQRFNQTHDFASAISCRYFALRDGTMTIEEIADFVRSVEPAEDVPTAIETPSTDKVTA